MAGSDAPTAYQPQHSAAVDSAYSSGLASQQGRTDDLYNFAQPAYAQQYQNAVNNPGNAAAMQGAWNVQQQGAQAGQDQLDRGNQEAGLATGAIQSGWDPQSANYNWGLGQTENAANANAAQSGIAGSPFGAGSTNDAVGGFIRNWQAGAQQRQGEGINQLNAINAGANADQTAGLNTIGSTSQAPEQQANAQQNQQMNMLAQYLSAMGGINGMSNANLGADNNYLNTGIAAASQATQAAQANQATSPLGILSSLIGDANTAAKTYVSGGGTF